MTISYKLPDFQKDLEIELGDSVRQSVTRVVGNPLTRDVYTDQTRTELYIREPGSDAVVIAANGRLGFNFEYDNVVEVKYLSIGPMVVGIDPTAAKPFYQSRPPIPPQIVNMSDIRYGGMVKPTNPPSMRVYVTGFTYWYNGAWHYQKPMLTDFFNTSPLDTESSAIDVPTTPNQAIAVLIQYDPSDNTLSYKQTSSAYDASNLLEDMFGSVPVPDTQHIPLDIIALSNGMTAITQDPHKMFNKAAWAWIPGLQDIVGVGDISAATEGDVLVFDSGGNVVPGAASGGAENYADLGDVDTTNIEDGTLAVYRSGTGNWEMLTPGNESDTLAISSGIPSWQPTGELGGWEAYMPAGIFSVEDQSISAGSQNVIVPSPIEDDWDMWDSGGQFIGFKGVDDDRVGYYYTLTATITYKQDFTTPQAGAGFRGWAAWRVDGGSVVEVDKVHTGYLFKEDPTTFTVSKLLTTGASKYAELVVFYDSAYTGVTLTVDVKIEVVAQLGGIISTS